MRARPEKSRYDVVVAGARVAGASTAMLLARRGMRVLVVDPTPLGSDTLSTHALMRGGVLQLARWGVLDAVRAAGTPAVRRTTFHYGADAVRVDIKPRDGVDALYAPRRTVLDRALVEAARASGAEVIHGISLIDVARDASGRVRGAILAGPDRSPRTVAADLVVGADGLRSNTARRIGAEVEHQASHAAATIYGYWAGLSLDGYQWRYVPGLSAGLIPTNEDRACVFISMSEERFRRQLPMGLHELYYAVLGEVAPEASDIVATQDPVQIRGFAGHRGFLRRPWGPGWALVGDAGYFRDPITAHGITDALRDAELLANAVEGGREEDFEAYRSARDAAARPLLEVTDRVASFDWTLEVLQSLHLELSRTMNDAAKILTRLDDRASPAHLAAPAEAIDARMAFTV